MNWGVPLGLNPNSLALADTPNASFDGPVFDNGGQIYNIGSAEYGIKPRMDITAAANVAIQKARNHGGGEVVIPPGDYYTSGKGILLDSFAVSLRGAGSRQTRIWHRGPGHSITWRFKGSDMYNFGGTGLTVGHTVFSPTKSSSFGRVLSGILIDGAYSSDGAVGLEYGDFNGAILHDVIVQNFSGVGSIGIWVNNKYGITEEGHWTQVESINNTVCVLFDRQSRVDNSIFLSVGSSIFTDTQVTQDDLYKECYVNDTGDYLGRVKSIVGSTVTVTGTVPNTSSGTHSIFLGGDNSWDYHKIYGLWIASVYGQVGIKFQGNGGQMIGGILHLTGNVACNSNNDSFLQIAGTNVYLLNIHANITIENDGTSGKGAFIRTNASSQLQMDGSVYGFSFGIDDIQGVFEPSGSWQTPSQNLDGGGTVSRSVSIQGTDPNSRKLYPTISQDGNGDIFISTPFRTDSCTVTNGSTTIADTSVTLADKGKAVIVNNPQSTTLGAQAFLGLVTSVNQGVSFVLDRSLGTVVSGACTLNLQGYGIYLAPNGADASRYAFLTYGGAFNVGGPVNSAPANCRSESVTLGTPLQNIGSDGVLTVYLSITANTSLVIKVGVASRSSDAVAAEVTVITGSTATGIVPLPICVPNNYYVVVDKSGTGTVSVMGAIWTPI